MALNDSAVNGDGFVPEEDRRGSLPLEVDLLESLDDIAMALKQAAVETREELLAHS